MKFAVVALVVVLCACAFGLFNPKVVTLPDFVDSMAGTFQGAVQQYSSKAMVNGSAQYLNDKNLGIKCAVVMYDITSSDGSKSDTFNLISLYNDAETDLYTWTTGFDCEHIQDATNDGGCQDWDLNQENPDGGASWSFMCRESNEVGPIAVWQVQADFNADGNVVNFVMNSSEADGSMSFATSLTIAPSDIVPPSDLCQIPDFCQQTKRSVSQGGNVYIGHGRHGKPAGGQAQHPGQKKNPILQVPGGHPKPGRTGHGTGGHGHKKDPVVPIGGRAKPMKPKPQVPQNPPK